MQINHVARKKLGSVVWSVGCAGMLSGLALLGFACGPKPTSLTVPMELHATDTPSGGVTTISGQGKVYVLPVDDKRTEKTKIGENKEDATPIPILPSSPPPAWVRQSFSDQFSANGLTVANSPDEADRLITVTLNTLWVEETSTYNAQLIATVQVQDKSGKVLWTGRAQGESSTFGKSLNAENYQQVMSNALVKAVAGVVSNTGFQQALVIQSGMDKLMTR